MHTHLLRSSLIVIEVSSDLIPKNKNSLVVLSVLSDGRKYSWTDRGFLQFFWSAQYDSDNFLFSEGEKHPIDQPALRIARSMANSSCSPREEMSRPTLPPFIVVEAHAFIRRADRSNKIENMFIGCVMKHDVSTMSFFVE